MMSAQARPERESHPLGDSAAATPQAWGGHTSRHPTIAVTSRIGGRRESTTYTVLYRISGSTLETLSVRPIAHVDIEPGTSAR